MTVSRLFQIRHLFTNRQVCNMSAFSYPCLIFVNAFPEGQTTPIRVQDRQFTVFVFDGLGRIVTTVDQINRAFTSGKVTRPVRRLAMFNVHRLYLIRPRDVRESTFHFEVSPPRKVLVYKSRLR